jgi:hypothetical protein
MHHSAKPPSRSQSPLYYPPGTNTPPAGPAAALDYPSNFYFVDAEWDGPSWVSLAIAGPPGVAVYFSGRKASPAAKERLAAKARRKGCRLTFVDNPLQTDWLQDYLDRAGVGRGEDVRLAFFFSPKDVQYAVGWEAFDTAIHKKEVRQRNNLSGNFPAGGRTMYLKDLYGWAGKKGLAGFLSAMGVATPAKGLMDEFKSNILCGVEAHPEAFLDYAVGDVTCLREAHARFVDHVRRLQRECLGMQEGDLWTAHDIPMTVGSLVAKTFEKWLHHHDRAVPAEALKFCVRKLGTLDQDYKRAASFRMTYWACLDQYRDLGSIEGNLREGGGRPAGLLKDFLGEPAFRHTAVGGAHVKVWADYPQSQSAIFNALVQGGRCNNERPDGYKIDNALDADLSGCYAEALRGQVFPLGLPSVTNYTANEKNRPTLGQWFSRHEADLVDGCWQCVVNGRLSFGQDLVPSKLSTSASIRKALYRPDRNEDVRKLQAEFPLLRRQVKNGVITSDVLSALRKVATDKEWCELQGELKVVTAAFYKKSDRADTLSDWCAAVLADCGAYASCGDDLGNVRDGRTRAWYGVPLEGFIGKLADERQHLKKLSGADAHADAMQATLKLFINTLYGDFASHYFGIGNVVLANNITAKARVGVWMLAKALGLRQCITDGGPYTPAAVPTFTGKRPGLDTLSRMWEWRLTRKGRTYLALGGLDWGEVFDSARLSREQLDRLAAEQVRQFWAPYGLQLPFNIEHKAHKPLLSDAGDCYIRRAAYWSKGDWAFLLRNGGRVYGVRGKDKRFKNKDGRITHPLLRLLDSILDGSDDFPADLRWERGGILSVKEYLRVMSSEEGFLDWACLRPGDNKPLHSFSARFNNVWMPLADVDDFLRRVKRRPVHHGKPTTFFERYAPNGVAHVHRHMLRNMLRLNYGLRSKIPTHSGGDMAHPGPP